MEVTCIRKRRPKVWMMLLRSGGGDLGGFFIIYDPSDGLFSQLVACKIEGTKWQNPEEPGHRSFV